MSNSGSLSQISKEQEGRLNDRETYFANLFSGLGGIMVRVKQETIGTRNLEGKGFIHLQGLFPNSLRRHLYVSIRARCERI